MDKTLCLKAEVEFTLPYTLVLAYYYHIDITVKIMVTNELLKKISQILYEFFVINNHAAAIQKDDGKYVTMYIPVEPTLIEQMLLSNGSMGCYQQGYRSKYIKWICVDFDCKNKSTPDLITLENELVTKLTDLLDEKKIRYLKEFSGRRGIHVWILFDSIISKPTGYQIISRLLYDAGLDQYQHNEFGIDLFPQTDSWSGNIVGKQVKLPLSCHKSGSRSFFFSDKLSQTDVTANEDFYLQQYDILSEYKPNNISEVLKSLPSINSSNKFLFWKYKPITIRNEFILNYNEVISILSETQIYKNIFERMDRGLPNQQDWYVLMGTFSSIDQDSAFLTDLLSHYPLYDETITKDNIKKLKGKYYPPTFQYLSQQYNIPLENYLDPESTGLEYLFQSKGIPFEVKQYIKKYKNSHFEIKDTVIKEINYLLTNDEVPDISTLNSLKGLRSLDLNYIKRIIDNAKPDVTIPEIQDFRVVKRVEEADKIRYMVSLSAIDRVITTHLALQIFQVYKKPSSEYLYSYSYNPSQISQTEIFYSWYKSWDNYLSKLKSFISVPFFKQYGVFYIDLKSFYSTIDFITVYNLLKEDLPESALDKLKYLIAYNDKLMISINNGIRLGVPQGPAYARIIAELFLNRIMSELLSTYSGEIRLYRYVDDMVFICNPDINVNEAYSGTINHLQKFGLNINYEKSKCFNTIGSLSNDDINYLLHLDNFSYELRSTADGYLLPDFISTSNFESYYYKNGFNIWKLGFFFSSMSSESTKHNIFSKHRTEIMKSHEGRGSNFRRFYEYILQNEALIEQINKENLFETIPVDSINFSNYVSSIYLSLESGALREKGLNIICNNHLSKIRHNKSISTEDKSVIEAIILLWGKEQS